MSLASRRRSNRTCVPSGSASKADLDVGEPPPWTVPNRAAPHPPAGCAREAGLVWTSSRMTYMSFSPWRCDPSSRPLESLHLNGRHVRRVALDAFPRETGLSVGPELVL